MRIAVVTARAWCGGAGETMQTALVMARAG